MNTRICADGTLFPINVLSPRQLCADFFVFTDMLCWLGQYCVLMVVWLKHYFYLCRWHGVSTRSFSQRVMCGLFFTDMLCWLGQYFVLAVKLNAAFENKSG